MLHTIKWHNVASDLESGNYKYITHFLYNLCYTNKTWITYQLIHNLIFHAFILVFFRKFGVRQNNIACLSIEAYEKFGMVGLVGCFFYRTDMRKKYTQFVLIKCIFDANSIFVNVETLLKHYMKYIFSFLRIPKKKKAMCLWFVF
jgi:hypothetical protein